MAAMRKFYWAELCVISIFVLSIVSSAQTIRVDTGHVANTFVPAQALGAGIDRLPAGAIDKLVNPETVKQVLSAGWQTVTYRQNTELYIEDWHWNPQGTWSDPSGKGYFTGSSNLGEPIRHSYGYLLPHRGYTRNDGVEGVGYSRLTDGDPNSYWKSNPYLAKPFTGEEDSNYPQWVILDLTNPQPVNAIRIHWAEPYARKYVVQYWNGDDPIKQATRGVWQTFPGGAV
ncbi:MAG TPA: discoidin domain-containing protein, partial [Terriglobales bacterium]|nr:discoidin domain-containing protein [Terriglobales bacterium]